MKWPSFAVLAAICIVLQTTIAPCFALGRVRPDWILVLAVFFAMHVRGLDVVLAGFVLGLLADMQSIERFGILGISYGCAAALVYLARDQIFRSHPLAQFAVTAVAGFVMQFFVLIFTMIFEGVGGGSWGAQIGGGMLIALYTAMWAPPAHALLLRVAAWTGIDVPRHAYARAG